MLTTPFLEAKLIALPNIKQLTIIISLVREILGSGSISIIDKLSQILGFKLIINLPKFSVFPNPFFVSSAGAFLTLGLILALLYKGDDKNELN